VVETAAALPVLTAKITPPGTDPAFIRKGTVERIAQGGDRRLLLLRAPAGYGKTTVVAEAARRLGWSTAWYTVDLLDRDPWTFAAGVVEAVSRVVPDFGRTLRSRLAARPELPLPPRELYTLLLSAFESELRGPLHLILDDYHEGAGERLDELLGYVLSTMPAGLHVTVLTRYQPGFSTARLRLEGQLEELPIDELRLTIEQAAMLLERTAGRSLDRSHVEHLLFEAEGWPAGLVLAGRALRAVPSTGSTDLADPRLRSDLFTYLAEQVFGRETRATRAFLKRSCCLERLTPELATRIGGSPAALRHLRDLVERGAFTFRDGNGRYRYHRLFRDYLRHKVTQEEGAEAHRQDQLAAAEACEETGDPLEAVSLFLAAGNARRGVAVIARHGEPLLDRCPPAVLREWSDRLGERAGDLHRWRLLLDAHVLMRDAEYDEALDRLRRAAADVDGDRDLRFLVASGVERTLYWKSEYEGAAAACDEALRTARRPAQRVHALVSRAAALVAANRWEEAGSALAEAESMAAAADPHERVRIHGQQVAILTVQGRFREASAKGRSALPEVQRLMPPDFVVAYLNLLALGRLYLAEYADADAALQEAHITAERCGCRFYEPLLWDARGQLEMARGNLASGLELCEQAEKHAAVAEDLGSRALALCHRATGRRRSGDVEQAADGYERAAALVADSDLHHPRLTCLGNREYVACLLDDRRSLALLERLEKEAEARILPFQVTRCALFAALVRDRRGAREEALWRLRQLLPTALDLGHLHLVGQELALAPELTTDLLAGSQDRLVTRQLLAALASTPRAVGVLVAALACGETVAREALRAGAERLPPADGETLLRRGRRHRNPAVRRAAADLQTSRGSTSAAQDALPELTRRETEVLALMAEGHRNAEIADLLVLEPTTVKKYVNRIFSKLGVEDRVQATLRFRRHAETAAARPPSPPATHRKVRE